MISEEQLFARLRKALVQERMLCARLGSHPQPPRGGAERLLRLPTRTGLDSLRQVWTTASALAPVRHAIAAIARRGDRTLNITADLCNSTIPERVEP